MDKKQYEAPVAQVHPLILNPLMETVSMGEEETFNGNNAAKSRPSDNLWDEDE